MCDKSEYNLTQHSNQTDHKNQSMEELDINVINVNIMAE